MARQQRLPFEAPPGQGTPATPAGQPHIRPLSDGEDGPACPEPLADEAQTTEQAVAATPRFRVPQPADSPAASAADGSEEDELVEDDVPMSLGQIMLDARRTASVSIKDVAERTKVPRAFIEAVEAERSEDFPPPVYARGHLAKMCATYKIAARPVLALYDATIGHAVADGEEPDHRTSRPGPPAGEPRQYQPLIASIGNSHGPSMGYRLTTWAVLLALAALAAVVVVAFAMTQWRNIRHQRESEALPADPAANATLAIEEFIPPQTLPLKEIPMPE